MGQVQISWASLWVCFILGKQLNFVQNYFINAISNILWSLASVFFPNNFKVAQNINWINTYEYRFNKANQKLIEGEALRNAKRSLEDDC